MDMGQGLLRVPQQPEGQRGTDAAGNTRVLAHAEHQRTALVWRVACDAFLHVLVTATGNTPRQNHVAPRV